MSIVERLPVAVIPSRSWATPITIGAFFLMSATGVLMFFGLDRGLAGEAHEWFSWLFLAGAGAHIAANSRPFMNHLKSPLGQGKRRDVRRRPRRLAHCGNRRGRSCKESRRAGPG